MNYESRVTDTDTMLGLPGPASSRRRWPVYVGVALVVLLAIMALRMVTAKPAAPAVDAKSQIPPVTVMVPGRTLVARTINATGSLAARIDMPVGVVGEGGVVRDVYVQPGTWVRAGQLLARVDRSVQTETAQSLAAQIKVAQADANIAQSELDRARALVDRGFISKADLDRKGATRDAALARVKVAQAQLAETNARNGRLDIRAPAAGLVL
ncbi:MAG: efflux RND transporter periplasmic adaptor subunit, partial [Sphingomonas sp.]